MKKMILFVTAIVMVAFLSGCSHNAAVFGFGKVIKIGNVEFEVTWVNGMGIIDYSRENSSWEIEVDEEDGLSWDAKNGTVKGVKRIKRTIGTQITGYLRDLAKVDPAAAEAYLSKDPLSIGIPEQKPAEAVVPEDPLKK